MRIDQIAQSKPNTLSFEFFPPKTDRAWYTLEDTIAQLVPFGPDFVSVTYGAGGGTRDKTRDIVTHIQDKHHVTAMAHLTCVGHTKDELRALLSDYYDKGIENILALRGDPPKGETNFKPVEGGCEYAADLMELINEDGRFATICAAFPEGHPDTPEREPNWDHLLRKLDLGAVAAITQCFFVVEPYLEMMTYLQRAHPNARVIPGILPVVDYPALVRFCKRCGADVPAKLAETMEPLLDHPAAARAAGIEYTINFCQDLLKAGAPGLHIYALNRSTAAAEIVTSLRRLGALESPRIEAAQPA